MPKIAFSIQACAYIYIYIYISYIYIHMYIYTHIYIFGIDVENLDFEVLYIGDEGASGPPVRSGQLVALHIYI